MLVARIFLFQFNSKFKFQKILCGAIEGVKTNRSGREISALSLLILSKEYPSLFAREECLKCLVACLKHDNLCDHSRFRSLWKYSNSSLFYHFNFSGIEYSSKFSTSVINRVLRQQVEWPTMLVHGQFVNFVFVISIFFNVEEL